MRKLTLVCAILGLSMGFVACSDDDDSSSSDKVAVGGKCKVAAECQSNVCENGVCVAKATDADACKDKNEGDVCDKDSKKTCQKENDKLVCKDKPAGSDTDACKDKNEGDVCDKDSKKTCQKENDKLVCKDKPAGSDTDACKDKNEGDVCDKDGNKTCQKENDKLVCKDKPAGSDADACKKDEDCTGEFNLCHVEVNKCYKLRAGYKQTCGSGDKANVLYAGQRTYKDGSEETVVEVVCSGDTPICSPTLLKCVANDVEELECSTHEDCKNKGNKTYCDTATHACVEPPQTSDECDEDIKPCTEENKTCVAGKCLAKVAANDPCGDDFVERCDSLKAMFVCDNKKVVRISVASGNVCVYSPEGKASSVEQCTAPLKADDVQYSDCDVNTNTAYNYICKSDYYKVDLFAFESTIVCGNDKVCTSEKKTDSGIPASCEPKAN